MFEIHASAKNNFDLKATQLLMRIRYIPPQTPQTPQIKSDVHITTTITDKDIIGEPKMSISDYQGNTTGRFFSFEKKQYGLVGSDHDELIKLAEAIQRLPAFREKLSQRLIEESMFAWVKRKFTKENTENSFISTLIAEASKVVQHITVRVPIAHTIVEAPFKFCGATIRNLSKAMVDDMAKVSESITDDGNKRNADQFFEDFRRKHQGYAVVELELECEPEYADSFSINAANRITNLLGVYSGAVLVPDLKCISLAKGTEHLAKFTTIKTAGDSLSVSTGILDKGSFKVWHISRLDLDNYAKCGLGIISAIANKKNTTEFESTVLNMSLLYSKCAFTADPLEKLVHVLAALESTLLKNENEPIQQNLAERIAIFTSQKLDERKAIIKNVKTVYGLRSRYLHHGHSVNELHELSQFLFNAWVFYVQLVANSGQFKNKSEFLNAIDDQKLG